MKVVSCYYYLAVNKAYHQEVIAYEKFYGG